MSSMPQTNLQQGRAGHETFPWKHIIGFVASLVLTGLAIWFVVSHSMPARDIIFAIVILALFQVFVQLFLFMHVTESIEQTRFHSLVFTMGLFFTVVVIAGSFWAMTWNALYVA
jgi:cytochrome aa3-600 menaquinol oxidase subunit IV